MLKVKAWVVYVQSVLQWRFGQIKRLLNAWSKKKDFLTQATISKAALGDFAYAEFLNGNITEGQLAASCGSLKTINDAILRTSDEINEIKKEQAPEFSEIPVSSGLVCPVCHKQLEGRFCPVDGTEGIKQENTKPAKPDPILTALVCPNCGRPVEKTFCVYDGSKGVLRGSQPEEPTKKDETAEEPSDEEIPGETELPELPIEPDVQNIEVEIINEQETSSEQKVILYCPNHLTPLNKKHCRECGAAGVPESELVKPVLENLSALSITQEKEGEISSKIAEPEEPVSDAIETQKPVIVCPNCGKTLAKRFCKDCGAEGIEFSGNENKAALSNHPEEIPNVSPVNLALKRVCPECGKEISKKFCKECGKEGTLVS